LLAGAILAHVNRAREARRAGVVEEAATTGSKTAAAPAPAGLPVTARSQLAR
jgi:hypothetical protein